MVAEVSDGPPSGRNQRTPATCVGSSTTERGSNTGWGGDDPACPGRARATVRGALRRIRCRPPRLRGPRATAPPTCCCSTPASPTDAAGSRWSTVLRRRGPHHRLRPAGVRARPPTSPSPTARWTMPWRCSTPRASASRHRGRRVERRPPGRRPGPGPPRAGPGPGADRQPASSGAPDEDPTTFSPDVQAPLRRLRGGRGGRRPRRAQPGRGPRLARRMGAPAEGRSPGRCATCSST